MKKEKFGFNEKQLNRIMKSVSKSFNVTAFFRLGDDDDDSPEVELFSFPGKDLMFVSEGLSKNKIITPNGKERVEVVVHYSYTKDLEKNISDDYLLLTDEIVGFCKTLANRNLKNEDMCVLELSQKAKERFGYEVISFIQSEKIIRIAGIGNISLILTVPLYENEYEYMKDYRNNSNLLNTMVSDIIKWYSDNGTLYAAINVKRPQLKYI